MRADASAGAPKRDECPKRSIWNDRTALQHVRSPVSFVLAVIARNQNPPVFECFAQKCTDLSRRRTTPNTTGVKVLRSDSRYFGLVDSSRVKRRETAGQLKQRRTPPQGSHERRPGFTPLDGTQPMFVTKLSTVSFHGGARGAYSGWCPATAKEVISCLVKCVSS